MHVRRWAIRPILLALTVAGCGTASGAIDDAAASAVTTAQSTAASPTASGSSSAAAGSSPTGGLPTTGAPAADGATTAPAAGGANTARATTGLPAQEPTTAPTRQKPSSTTEAPTAGVTDPAAPVRAAALATADQPWVALTVSVSSQQPVTMIYENGDLVGCSGWPNGAASYTLPTLVDALAGVTAVGVRDGVYDPTGSPQAIPFYDVRLDEAGRLAGATWYAGEIATFYAFSYDHSRTSSCPGTTLP